MKQQLINILEKLDKKIGYVGYISHYFNINVNSFTYYFFAQAIIILTKGSSLKILGIAISTIFFLGGLFTSSFPTRKRKEPEELSWGYILAGLLTPLLFGLSIIYLSAK